MCVGSLAGVTYLRYTVVLTNSNKSETAVCFIGSCHVGVSKRFSHLADQVSCRSYVGSASRMRSLAVIESLIILSII